MSPTPSTPDLSPSALADIQAVITSPLGEVRVWIEPDDTGGRLRTVIRHDFAEGADAGLNHDSLARVANQLEQTIRRLGPVGRPATQASPVARWLADRTETGPAWRTPAGDLYRDFLNWCDANGVRAVSQRAFGDALADRGFRNAGLSSAGLRYRGGLRLRPGPVVVASAPSGSIEGGEVAA